MIFKEDRLGGRVRVTVEEGTGEQGQRLLPIARNNKGMSNLIQLDNTETSEKEQF